MLKRLENLHILFWLVKDLCWCLVYRGLGIAMVIPTFSIAVYIAVKSYKCVSDFVHNLSVLFWITANSIWMITEFYKMEHDFLDTGMKGKYVAAFFFGLGIVIPLLYYTYRLYKRITDHLIQ